MRALARLCKNNEKKFIEGGIIKCLVILVKKREEDAESFANARLPPAVLSR